MAWLVLILGGLFEIGFTTSLRFVDGFRNLPWTLAFLVSVGISMALLELASRTIPMGTAYAVWGGIGAVGTVLVGILFFNQPAAAQPNAAPADDLGDEEEIVVTGQRARGSVVGDIPPERTFDSRDLRATG